jgi:hypothetical protein
MSTNERTVGRHPLHQESIRLEGRAARTTGTQSGGSGDSGRSGGRQRGRR